MACFYDNGLAFECQGCSYCCSSEPGYVFLSESDIKKLSDYMSVSEQDFVKLYCRRVGSDELFQLSLIEKANYDCIFLKDGKCSVYNARPLQCRTYPFWKSILKNSETWKRESLCCPGINKGRCYTKKEIDAILNKTEANKVLIKTEK